MNRSGRDEGWGALPTLGSIGLALALASCAQPSSEEVTLAQPASDPVEHGAYLVHTSGCEQCHTPGGMYNYPDSARKLAGSDLGWKGPWGVRYPHNLTPDVTTGIGGWSEDQIVAAIRLAQHPDRTPIRGAMPWVHFVYFDEADAHAIAKYLKSIPPVQHKVPEAIPPSGMVSGPVVVIPPPPPWDAPKKQ